MRPGTVSVPTPEQDELITRIKVGLIMNFNVLLLKDGIRRIVV
jgi:hypothetical protein